MQEKELNENQSLGSKRIKLIAYYNARKRSNLRPIRIQEREYMITNKNVIKNAQ